MEQHDDKTLLSMAVIGRNDDYMGNFKYRLNSCLDFIARNLAELDALDRVELLVTDWGSEVPLSTALNLTSEAARITRFFYVPPALSGKKFYPVRATNTGLRRARGKYLMLFDADSLVPRFALRNVLDVLDGRVRAPFDLDRTLMLFCRHQVPYEIVQREPTLEEWDRYLTRAAGVLPRDAGLPGLGGSSAGLAAHRDIWFEVGAFDEQHKASGWSDAEFTLRVTQKYSWIDLECLGVSAFHQEHWVANKRGLWIGGVNDPIVPLDMRVNDDDWGLAGQPVEEQQAQPSATPGTARDTTGWTDPLAAIARGMEAPAAARHVTWNAQLPIRSRREWEALCLVAWFSLKRPPLTFLEYGYELFCAAALPAASSPGVELYLVGPWQQGPSPNDGLVLLKEVGHRGFTRLLTGDPTTAFRRLLTSPPAPDFRIDLGVVRTEMLGADPVEQLVEMIAVLERRGGLVVISPSAEDLAGIVGGVQARRPELAVFLAASGATALLLTDATPGKQRVDLGRPRPRSVLRQTLMLGRWVYRRLLQRQP